MNTFNTRRKQRGAFTLIELLVVIAIIAILAAILFPVFAQAREKARAITCVSNEKQIALAVLMYQQDFDEVFPLAQRVPSAGEEAQMVAQGGTPQAQAMGLTYCSPVDWQTVVEPYIRSGNTDTGDVHNSVLGPSGGVFSCPDFPAPPEPNEYVGNSPNIFGDETGYGFWDSAYESNTDAGINEPSEKIMICERGYMGAAPDTGTNYKEWSQPAIEGWEYAWNAGNFNGSDLALANNDNGTQTQPYPWPAMMPRFRHQGLGNFAFADGHVAALHPGDLAGPNGWCNHLFAVNKNFQVIWGNIYAWYPNGFANGQSGPSACNAYGGF